VLVRATSSGALHNLAHLRSDLTVHWGDLTDRRAVDRAVGALKGAGDPPYVFHLGAQAHVGESWARPYETIAANVVGTLNLLQSLVDHGVELERLSTSGTSEEYGNVDEAARGNHRFDADGGLVLHEHSPLNPKSIYATSKLASDFLTQNYADAYGLPAIVTRMFNNYGPRQNPRYVTGTIVTQALERERIELGNLDPRRDFCFCTDGVRAHLLVATNGTPGAVYCFGQGESISIGEWAELILRLGEEQGLWRGRELASVVGRYRPGASDVMALRADSSLLERETGWSPLVSWEEGLRRTIAWYAAHPERWRGRVDWVSTDPAPLRS
jgi:dTDP-glucose 4,6-dehydratase